MNVFLNGSFIEEKQALISPFDRGFLYGDGVFETIRSYNGKIFAWIQHIERLRAGLNELKISLHYTDSDIYRFINILLKENQLLESDAYIRITVTRGVTKDIRDFSSNELTVFIYTRPIQTEKIFTRRKDGVNAFFVPFCRGDYAELKHLGYLHSLKALMLSENINGEPIFTKDGNVLEGATSNIFFYDSKKRIIVTPQTGILKGVIRNVLIDILAKEGISVEERTVTIDETKIFTSAFITNSIVEVVGVAQLEEKRYALNDVNFIIQLFEKYKALFLT